MPPEEPDVLAEAVSSAFHKWGKTAGARKDICSYVINHEDRKASVQKYAIFISDYLNNHGEQYKNIMKKVILLAPTPPPAGGIAGWTARMMKARLKCGWKVVVVDEKSIGRREVFGEKGKRHLLDELKRCYTIWRGLRKALRDPETKIVQSCIPSYTRSMLREYVCAWMTKWYKRKYIVHFRCTVPNAIHNRLDCFMLKRLCSISDMVFTLNRQSSAFLSELTQTPIKLIPNFVSKEELISERQIHDELRRIIYVGGIVENKGIRDILDIAEQLQDIQFFLIGEGDRGFEEDAKLRGLTNVVFKGSMDRSGVQKELLEADAFLFLTHFPGEGFSNSLCEAMAAGLPCVVTDWAANRDMIGDKGGAVIGIGDIQAAVSAIQSMRDSEIRKRMSVQNIEKVKMEYLEPMIIGQYVDIYESIME